MKAMAALLIGLVSLHACVESDDPAVAEQQQDERIEVHGCRPGTVELGEGDDFICIDPWDGIDPGWGAGERPIWGERPPRVPPPPPVGDGSAEPVVRMDPEPDHNKDRNSCEDWCDWSRRQCEKWCWKEYPNVIGDWNKRRVCFEDRCDNHKDPNIGYKSCRSDCQRRFPERPIVTIEAPQ